jgi:CubicO group peptidase (beta-lactamase class C family)
MRRPYDRTDFNLVAPLRHASGFIRGAKAFSLFGPDTGEAFGHLGFTNVLGWADPERVLSVELMTSGMPLLHPALAELWLLTRAIRNPPGGAQGAGRRYLVQADMTPRRSKGSGHPSALPRSPSAVIAAPMPRMLGEAQRTARAPAQQRRWPI